MQHRANAFLLFVLLAATAQAQYEPVAEEEKGKPFTVSATLREEYDDNIFTSDTDQEESWKTEIVPSFVFNYPLDQTLLSARLTYGLTYFGDRPGEDFDHHVDFVGRVAHTFSPRFDIDIRDRFRYEFEPDLQEGGTTRRVDGDYIMNEASAFARFQWVPRFGNTLEYVNRYIDYNDHLISISEDRMEHTVNLENRWQVQPATVGVIGYRFNYIAYRGIERDSLGHIFFGGVDHKLLDTWVASMRAGAEFRDFEAGDDEVGPWVSMSTTYNYLPGSSLSFGYTHSFQTTDIGAFTTTAADSFSLSLSHAITPKLGFRVSSSYTINGFDGDNTIGEVEDVDKDFNEYPLFVEGAVTYGFSRYLSAEAGYIRTQLDSDFEGRDYERNRYYIGVRGTY